MGGLAFHKPSSICYKRGNSFSEPTIFVGLEFVAKAIV